MTSNAGGAVSISCHALPCRSPLSAVVWEATLPRAFALQWALIPLVGLHPDQPPGW